MSDRSGLVKNAGILVGVLLFVGLVAWGPLRGALPMGDPDRESAGPRIPPKPPRELAVPRLKMRAKVVDVSVGKDLTLRPPRQPTHVGWWSGSARPGAEVGRTVIAGHTVHTGGGALDKLKRVKVGDTVDVRTSNAVAHYRVQDVTTYHKDELAKKAAELFDKRGSARLVVVTCDDWDGSAYRSNVVALAEPTSVDPAPKPTPSGSAETRALAN